MDWDWDDVFKNLREVVALLLFVGIWVFGLIYRAFFQKPQQRRQRPAQPPAVRPEEPRAAVAQDPPDPRDEVQNFLEKLRRQAEDAAKQQQQAARPVEARGIQEEAEDEWVPLELEEDHGPPPQVIEPRRRLPQDARRRPAAKAGPSRTPLPRLFAEPLDTALPIAEGSTQSIESTGLYSPPGELQLPNWMTLQEIANVSRADEIVGIPARDAILISEILAPPRALRPLRPGTGARSPQS